jgi:hypothetical protein
VNTMTVMDPPSSKGPYLEQGMERTC